MSGTLVQVEFVRSWQQYCVGDRITPNGTLRDWLVSSGFVRVVNEVEAPSRPARMTRAAAAKLQTSLV